MYQASCYHYDTRVLIYIMIEALRLRSFGFESAAEGYESAAEGYWQISLFRNGKLYYLREELLPWYPLGCRARRAVSVDRGRVQARPAVSVDRREPVCLAPGQR